MKTSLLAAAAVATVAIAAAPAHAAEYLVPANGTVFDLPLTLTDLGGGAYTAGQTDTFRTGLNNATLRSFTINYSFAAPVDGSGSISFTTTSTVASTALLRLNSATFNGAPVTITAETAANGAITYNGMLDYADAVQGQPFTLSLAAQVRRGGSLSTSVSYVAGAVPEPASWAMMIGGFGVVGGSLRRRRTSVRFA